MRPSSILSCILVLLAAGCGMKKEAVSGVATYERVPVTDSGLDYSAIQTLPIAGARVVVMQGDHIAAETVTGADGSFSVKIAEGAMMRLGVLAEDGSQTVRVVDDAEAVWGIYRDVHAGDGGLRLQATSGWTGSAYDPAKRTSGPFAIFATLRQAGSLLATVGAHPPALTVYWDPTAPSSAAGTSYFEPKTGTAHILARADDDTDEFDDHVIAHEWGHAYEAWFSRSDSIGGHHAGDDFLDETVAWSEGFADAMSGIVTGDPVYRDAIGVGQATTGVRFDLESEPAWRDGPWDEMGIAEVVWDLFDSSDDPAHGDAISLGFAPIHQAMVGKHKTTPAFTSAFSFLDALVAVRPGDTAAIGSVAAAAALDGHDQYWYVPDVHRYTVVPGDGTWIYLGVDGLVLHTDDLHGTIPDDAIGNKFLNRVFCRVVLPGTGSWAIRARPVDVAGNPVSADLYLMRAGSLDIADEITASSSPETLVVTGSGGKPVCFAVGGLAGPHALAVSVGPATTPAPSAAPALPRGDG